MAKKKDEGNTQAVKGEDVAPEQRDAEGNPAAAREGESALSYADVVPEREQEVNQFSSVEESERQRAENFPRKSAVEVFDGHEDMEQPRAGYAATSRAVVGRVVVLDEDTEHDGELYKAGVQDLPLEVADALVGEGKAFEPAGKKRGR